MNGTTTALSTGAAMLAELKLVRERTYAALREERAAAIARVEEIDAMLAEVDPAASTSPLRRERRRSVPIGASKTAAALAFIAANPGAKSNVVRDATGLSKPELTRMKGRGLIRSERQGVGRAAQSQWWVVAPQTQAAE